MSAVNFLSGFDCCLEILLEKVKISRKLKQEKNRLYILRKQYILENIYGLSNAFEETIISALVSSAICFLMIDRS